MAGEVRKFCMHCEESLAPRTFREHVRLYYDTTSHSWTKKRKRDAESAPVVADNTELEVGSCLGQLDGKG